MMNVRQWTSGNYEYVIICNFPYNELNRLTINNVIIPSMKYANFQRLKVYCGEFNHLAAPEKSNYDVMYNLNQIELYSSNDMYPNFQWFILDPVADQVSVEFAAAKSDHVIFADFAGLMANNTETRCKSYSYEIVDVTIEGSDDVLEAVRLANDRFVVSQSKHLLITTIYTND